MCGRLRTLRVCFATARTSPAPQFSEMIYEKFKTYFIIIEQNKKIAILSNLWNNSFAACITASA
jgi:hypothetical protein